MINRDILQEAIVREIARMLATGEAECNDQGVIVLTTQGEKVAASTNTDTNTQLVCADAQSSRQDTGLGGSKPGLRP